MDANDVKNRFQDVVPPESVKKPTELNMQSRKMMVNDPMEPTVTEKPVINVQDSAPLEVQRETTIDPMLTQPSPASEPQPVQEGQNIDGPDSPENNYKIPEASPELKDESSDSEDLPEAENPESSQATDLANETPAQDVNRAEETAAKPEELSAIQQPAITQEQTTTADESSLQPETAAATEVEAVQENEVSSTSSFKSVDGLPDTSTQSANAIKDDMQEPKIYDTSVYHVPIKETVHGHGAVKSALIFGAIFAVIVVGALVFILFKFSS